MFTYNLGGFLFWIYSIYIRDLWKMIFTNTNFDDCGKIWGELFVAVIAI